MEVVGNADFIEIVNRLKNEKPFPHVLIWGPSGAGKTTLGKYISSVTKNKIITYYGPELDKMILNMVLSSIQKNVILVIDEIHALRRGMLEQLYQPIEDGQFQGNKINQFTLIGITTDLNSLPDALIRRFRLVYRVSLYDIQELMDVLNGLKRKKFDDSAIESIANMSRGSPGVARNHLQIIEQIFKKSKVIEYEDVETYQRLKHVNMIGLEDVDIEYLKCLRTYGALSLSTISSILVEREKAIEHNVEPYLFRLGFVFKTSKGRQITPRGEQYMDGNL